MHIIKFGTSPGDFIGPFAFKSDAEMYARALSRGTHLDTQVIPLRSPRMMAGPESLLEHLHRQILENRQ